MKKRWYCDSDRGNKWQWIVKIPQSFESYPKMTRYHRSIVNLKIMFKSTVILQLLLFIVISTRKNESDQNESYRCRLFACQKKNQIFYCNF